MKVYLELPVQSRGLQRVRNALVKYKPANVELAKSPSESDLTIIHVYGRHDSVKEQVDWLKKHNTPYVMIQYCLRSTMRPSAKDWLKMWSDAKLVWSYYDLNQIICHDNICQGKDEFLSNFYYSPLGAEPVFKNEHLTRNYTILGSSQHALTEGVRECAIATKKVGGKMIHLGHDLRRGDDIQCVSNVDDEMLAVLYSQSQFVSGLRRVEGFEFPVVEGLLCGARPIVFDRPEMRQWFGEFAEFIPEGTREEVIESLKKLFRKGARPVTAKEIKLARERFNWETIIKEFWERVM